MKNAEAKRLFLAVDIPTTLKEEIISYTKTLRLKNVKITPPENLHITAYFLGDTDNAKIPDLIKNLKIFFQNRKPLKLKLKGVEHIGNKNSMVWVTLVAGTLYKNFIKGIENTLSTYSQIRGEKNLTPHITITRLKKIDQKFDLPKARFSKKTIDVHNLKLFESNLGRNGPTYHLIKTFKLGKNT